MLKSASRRIEVDELQEILSSKRSSITLNEAEQKTLHGRVRAPADAQVKSDIELFARRIVGPQLDLMKAVKNAAGRQAAVIGKSADNASASRISPRRRSVPMSSGASPQPPTPTAQFPPWLRASLATWLGQYVPYPPPYTSADPSSEVDVPLESPPFGGDTATKVMLSKVDGNISLGAAVGTLVGVENGPDTWLFGDGTIASGTVYQLVQVPKASGSATVQADITVNDGKPPLPYLSLITDPGWVGVLGMVVLTLSAGAHVSVAQKFLFDWRSAIDVPSGNFWLSDFSVSGSIDFTQDLVIGVTASLAVLRVSTFDGFTQNQGSIQFFDPTVKGVVGAGGSFGPIQVTNLGVWFR